MSKPHTIYYTAFQDTYGATQKANNSIFRNAWLYPSIPKKRKGEYVNSFDKVYTNEFILDIDMADVNEKATLEMIDYNEAEKSIKKIINWFKENYPKLKVNVWFSGRKGYHIAINFNSYYNYKHINYGGASNHVICYHELATILNKLIDSNNIKVDMGLAEVTRIIQLPNVLKQQDDPANPKDRGYKVCIWNNDKSINDFPNKNDMIKASRSNKNIVEPSVNTKKTSRAFISYLNSLEKNAKKPKANKKANTNKSEYIDFDDGKAQSIDGFERMQKIDSVLYPLKEYLYELHPQDGHSKVRCPIISMCGLYLPKAEMEYIFNYLKSDKRGSDKSNPRQGLVNFYNECVKNRFEGGFNTSAVVESLGALSKEAIKEKKQELKDNAPKGKRAEAIQEGKDLELENKKKWMLFYELKKWLAEAKEYFEMLKGSQEFSNLLKTNDNDLVNIFDKFLIDYINNSEGLTKGIIFSLATGLGWAGQFIQINDIAGNGKTAYYNSLFSLISNGLYLGIITKAAFTRKSEEELNNKVIYLHDTGLETKEEKKETEKIKRLLRELVTDGKLKYTKSDSSNDTGTVEIYKEVEALSLIITELYTEAESYEMGQQIKRVSEIIDINGISYDDQLNLQEAEEDENKQNALKYFKSIFRAYYKHCIYRAEPKRSYKLNRDIRESITNPEVDKGVNDRIIAYYKAFCLFFDYDCNNKVSASLFNSFYDHTKTNKQEALLRDALFKYITPVDLNNDKFNPEYEGTEQTDLELKLKYSLNSMPKKDKGYDYVNKNGNPIHFFTVDNAKSYLYILFAGKLKEYKDMTSKLLGQLEKQGYIRSIHEIKDRKLYYIPKEEKKV